MWQHMLYKVSESMNAPRIEHGHGIALQHDMFNLVIGMYGFIV